MRKRVLLVFTCLVIILTPSVALADNYKDGMAQIEFAAPVGWTETELSEEREIIKVKYLYDPDSVYTESIMFGYTDLYNSLPEIDRMGVSRAEIDNSFISVSDVADMFGISEDNVRKVSYNNTEYFESEIQQTEAYGMEWNIHAIQLVRFYNGFIYTFYFSYWTEDKAHYSDFEDMVRSAKYLANVVPSATPAPNKTKESSVPAYDANTYRTTERQPYDFNLGNLVLSFIVTIAIYSLPIIIYRYGIRKRAMEKRKAKIVTIVYGIIAFIGMTIILYSIGYGPAGSAIVFWSYVNYRMLTSGVENMPQQEFNSVNSYVVGSDSGHRSNDAP